MEKKLLVTLALTMLSGMAFAAENGSYNSSTTNQAEDRIGAPSGHLSGANEGMSGSVVGGDGTASDNAANSSSTSSLPNGSISSDTSNGAENRVGAPSGHLSGANEGMSGNVLGGDGTASDNAANDSMSGGAMSSSTTSATSLSGATSNPTGVTGIGDTMSFTDLDVNQDGMVSRSEYDDHMMRMHSAMSGDNSSMPKGSDAGKSASPQSPGPGGSGMGVADQDTAHSKAPQ